MLIFSIKNEKLGFFNRPIYCESSQEALSYIQNVLMSDSDRALLNLKDDLALYQLGTIDFTTGFIFPTLDGDEDPSGCEVYEPMFICTLAHIFDTIPEDKLKPALTRDDISAVVDKVSELERQLKNHAHKDKGRGGVLIG